MEFAKAPGFSSDRVHGVHRCAYTQSDSLWGYNSGSFAYKPSGAGDGRLSLYFFADGGGSWNGVIRVLAEVSTVAF